MPKRVKKRKKPGWMRHGLAAGAAGKPMPPDAMSGAMKNMQTPVVQPPCKEGEFIYSIPNSKLLTLLIVVMVFIVIVLYAIFRYAVAPSLCLNDSTNGSVSIYLTMVALPVGVTLSFIVASAWAAFSDAQSKEAEEASQMFLLYNLLGTMPGGEEIQTSLKSYTEYVINIEFPLYANGMITESTGFNQLLEIGDAIYAMDPEDERQQVLYNDAIMIFQRIVALRIIRNGYAGNGIASELWWVLVLGVVIAIFMSFFVYMQSWALQTLMIALVTATLVSLLFIILALDFPYRGDFGLDPFPFELALNSMNDNELDGNDDHKGPADESADENTADEDNTEDTRTDGDSLPSRSSRSSRSNHTHKYSRYTKCK